MKFIISFASIFLAPLVAIAQDVNTAVGDSISSDTAVSQDMTPATSR